MEGQVYFWLAVTGVFALLAVYFGRVFAGAVVSGLCGLAVCLAEISFYIQGLVFGGALLLCAARAIWAWQASRRRSPAIVISPANPHLKGIVRSAGILYPTSTKQDLMCGSVVKLRKRKGEAPQADEY